MIKELLLSVDISPANLHDSKLLQPVLKIEKSTAILIADSAFDAKRLYQFCSEKNIILDAATNIRRNKNKPRYKPKNRWVVERIFGWLSWYRGLKICWTKTKISHLAFLNISCSVQLFKISEIFV